MKTLLDTIPYARFLGVKIDETSEGSGLILPFRDELIGNNRLPAIHGGVVGAFLELVAIAHVINSGDSDRLPKPINFSLDYLRSAKPMDVHAKAETVKHGRRIANVRVTAWQNEPERPIAAGIANFLL